MCAVQCEQFNVGNLKCIVWLNCTCCTLVLWAAARKLQGMRIH